MNINPIGQGAAGASAQTSVLREPVTTPPAAVLQAAALAESNASNDNAVAYRRDEISIDRIQSEARANAIALRRMAEKLITEQYAKGNHLFQLLYGGKAVQLDPSLRPPKLVELDAEPEVKAEAREIVGEEGYFGVMQTSDRLLGLSRAVLAGNTAELPAVRNAVAGAFDDARRHMGNVSPEITRLTFEATMQGFDSWSAEISATEQSTPAGTDIGI